MSDSHRRAQVRQAVLRFYHAVEWLVIGIIVAAAFVVEPGLLERAEFLAACVLWIFSLLLIGRAPWPITDEETRLVAAFLVSLLGTAAVLWLVRPSLNGLLVTFPIATTTAWIALPRARALGVLVLACALSAAVSLAPEPSLTNLLFAVAVSASCFLTAWVAALAMDAAVIAHASAAAANARDELTGLPGRHAFLRQAQEFHALCEESKSPYAIEIVDINNLRAINDSFGYAAGDRAILVVAQALERLSSSDELLARYEGDKFVLLLPQLDDNRADELARRIRSVIYSTTIKVDAQLVRIKANVGVARYPLSGVTISALLSEAERDMKVDQRGREPPGVKPVFRRRSGKMSA